MHTHTTYTPPYTHTLTHLFQSCTDGTTVASFLCSLKLGKNLISHSSLSLSLCLSFICVVSLRHPYWAFAVPTECPLLHCIPRAAAPGHSHTYIHTLTSLHSWSGISDSTPYSPLITPWTAGCMCVFLYPSKINVYLLGRHLIA